MNSLCIYISMYHICVDMYVVVLFKQMLCTLQVYKCKILFGHFFVMYSPHRIDQEAHPHRRPLRQPITTSFFASSLLTLPPLVSCLDASPSHLATAGGLCSASSPTHAHGGGSHFSSRPSISQVSSCAHASSLLGYHILNPD
jgi:hypothetical protein